MRICHFIKFWMGNSHLAIDEKKNDYFLVGLDTNRTEFEYSLTWAYLV